MKTTTSRSKKNNNNNENENKNGNVSEKEFLKKSIIYSDVYRMGKPHLKKGQIINARNVINFKNVINIINVILILSFHFFIINSSCSVN